MMNPLHYFAGETAITALGWTLIHSLWQIALIGILLKAGLKALKNKPAEIRSVLSSVSLISIAVVSIVTFIKIYNAAPSLSHADLTEVNLTPVLSDPEFTLAKNDLISEPSAILILTGKVSAFINSNLTVIVALWLAGMLFFSVRFAGSYLYINRLRHYNTSPVTGKLTETLTRLQTQLSIRKKIRLVESLLVKIPMVIGHLKPVVIIPAGLAAALPYDQVEAIIAHELAHIRRNDYFLNFIKSVIQVIYFYHPVIWWISAEMEKERENCCDDITIRVLGDEKSLQNALISLQEFEQKSVYVAAAFLSKKYKLLNRIKRMKTTNQIKQGFKGSLAGYIILLGGIIMLTTGSAFSPELDDLPGEYKTQNTGIISDNLIDSRGKVSGEKTGYPETTVPVKVTVEPDTVKSSQSNEDKAKVTLEFDGNYNLISVKKDGKPLEGDEKKEFEAMAEKMKKMNEEQAERENQRLALEKAEKELQTAQEQIEKARMEYEKAMEAYNDHVIIAGDDMTKVMVWTEEDSDNLKKAMKEIKVITDVGVGETPKAYSYSFSDHDFVELPEDCLHEIAVEADVTTDKLADLKELEREMKLIKIEKELDGQGDSKKIVIKHSGSDDLLETLKTELVNDGILRDNDERMNFSLTQDEVEVNGQKLSDELHKKYLKIYSKETGNKLNGDFKIVIKN